MQLAHARLGHPEEPPDLGERPVLQVVELHDRPVALAEPATAALSWRIVSRACTTDIGSGAASAKRSATPPPISSSASTLSDLHLADQARTSRSGRCISAAISRSVAARWSRRSSRS